MYDVFELESSSVTDSNINLHSFDLSARADIVCEYFCTEHIEGHG